MKSNVRYGVGIMFAAILLVSMAFVPAASAKEILDSNPDLKEKYIIGETEITITNSFNLSSANIDVNVKGSIYQYKVDIVKSDTEYIAKIYDVDGNLIKTDSYASNPLLSSDGDEPAILRGSIIVDADIDIYPNKYSYNQNEYGTINVVVDNYALPDGYSTYYLRIPLDITYINVYDGLQPDNVINLPSSSHYVFIPEKGRVYGPSTVLYWQDLHLFGYDEHIKVKVKHTNTGTFNPYAYDHVQEVVTGLPAWDDDNFYVTVS